MDQGEFPSTGVSRPPTSPTAPPKPAPKISGTAIASLICGITGSVLFFTAIVGIILGIVSLKQIKRSSGEKSGKGIAIAGIIVSSASLALMVFVALLMMSLMLPALSKAREAAKEAITLAEAQDLLEVTLLHEKDNGTLPAASGWELTLYTIPVRGLNDDGIPWVAMNEAVGGLPLETISNPAQTVLYFEVVEGSVIESGGPSDLPVTPQHRSGYLIIFVEGGAQFIPTEQLNSLKWEP